ncbi:sensor histidine kinase [Bacillus sp. FJAT-49736]|uniref:sensor histidine kinase n=1 Tax=Bacillus sp. FJAT-49736 TaxID=2833582 RepID=UPI001BC944BC|nr:sensor histidine kinase [Bacillus sp. FJAT-49736]MBS4172354.1 sensor histidine kinase [Bacillus sp. FJAT-49736]
MSIQRTFLFYFCFCSIIIAAFVTTVYCISVQTDWYHALFFTQIFLIPVVVFILLTSLIVGGIFGLVIGYFVKKKMEEVETHLVELQTGEFQLHKLPREKVKEISVLYEHFSIIQNRFEKQVKASQKLANEKADWSEKLKQEVLSQERNRLARELHDSVSQQLFAANMLLSAINQNPDPESAVARKQLKLVEEIINDSQSEMRALLLHLRPIQLEGKSLRVGMEELLHELTAKLPMKVTWKIEDVKLDKGVEDHLFRIVQESISNTLRHAKAKLLELHLLHLGQFVLLKIIDDGIGFELEKEKAGSYGLQNIRERAAEIGGTVKMISFPQKGTSIEVKVPIMNIKDETDD